MAENQPSLEPGQGHDPASERLRRKLVRFMAINLSVLFVALMAVVVAIVYRAFWQAPESEQASELQVPPQGSMFSGEIPLPEGARLISHAVSGNRLTFDVEIEGGRSILIYDIAEGRMIGRFALVDGLR